RFHCYLKYTGSGIPSRVTTLIGVTSGFSLSRQESKTGECLSSVYHDVDFPGSDYSELPSFSYSGCQKACTRDPYCRFFSFTTERFSKVEKRKMCFLKYSWPVPMPPGITTKSGLVSGFSQSIQEAMDTFKEECNEEILANKEFPGNNFEQVPAGSPQHCQFLCSIHPRCTHFSYSQSNTWFFMTCFLKHKPNVNKEESVGKEKVYSGITTHNCKPSNVWESRYEGIDFYGADNGHTFVDSADICEDFCTQDPDCQFYTYLLPSYPNLTPQLRNKCYLKQVMTLPRPDKVVSVPGVVSGFSLKNCKDESLADEELKVDVDFPGNDILQIYSPDVHHCQLACTEHHSCLFFTFLRPDWSKDDRKFYCYLKHTSSGIPSRVTELKGVTSGYSLALQENKTFSCLSSTYKDVNFPGSDFRELPLSSYYECQKECSRDPFCRFFTFMTESFPVAEKRKTCYLKYSWSVPVPPVVTATRGLVSGFSQSPQKPPGAFREDCELQILANTGFPGNDLETVPAGSAQHCQFLCSMHPSCSHFSYSERNTQHPMSCFLKKKPGMSEAASARQEGLYSGFSAPNCEASDVWGSRFEDVDFYGADSGYAVVDNADICEDKCTADPGCQFYTYVLPTYHDQSPKYRNRCQLKRVMILPRPAQVVAMPGVVSGFSLKTC
ncbi:hypothetical protein NFI96_012675, partial [Prochilodus magdalenae]